MKDQRHIDGRQTSGAHFSCWLEPEKPLQFQQLKENVQADVVVVGGGISGITVAYCLCKAGKSVVLVEDGFIGSGETGRTTAHIVSALDDRYESLAHIFGEEGARLTAESHQFAIRWIAEIIAEEKISCDHATVDGYLFLHPSDKPDALDKEWEAARNAGITVEKTEIVPGMKKRVGALKFPDQAQFHPMKYLEGLCAAILRMGGSIYTETHASEIHGAGIVTADGYRVHAGHVVVATNAPVNNMFLLPVKQYAYRTYAIAANIPKGSLPQALWWDTGDFHINSDIPPYHYVRTAPYNETSDLLICGGEDHATGLADADGTPEEERYAALEQWMHEHFEAGETVFRWSGQVMEPMDSLAYIGRNPGDEPNVYVVSGDSGNGMTHGTIAGKLITDLILGDPNPWEKIYSPKRFRFFKTGSVFVKEFMGGLFQYLKTKPQNTDAEQLHHLEKGEGIVVKIDGEKYAVHRDAANDLHFVSAECTHQQCILKWNADEASWDCPCHGSRFTHTGEVVNGPANEALEYYKEKYSEQS